MNNYFHIWNDNRKNILLAYIKRMIILTVQHIHYDSSKDIREQYIHTIIIPKEEDYYIHKQNIYQEQFQNHERQIDLPNAEEKQLPISSIISLNQTATLIPQHKYYIFDLEKESEVIDENKKQKVAQLF